MPGFNVPAPSTQQENPYLPPGPTAEPLMFEEFAGINTATLRPGVDDKQMAWCDGFIPLSRMNLRTLYGIGSSLWPAPGGQTISFFDFGNIGATPYLIGITSAGGIWAVNTLTTSASQIFTNGTLSVTDRQEIGINQWGSQYILITAKQTNGYFIWDGTVTYKAGTLGPVVTLTNVGSGYTSAPTVTANGGHGTGSSFLATVANGIVTGVSVTNAGSGYLAGDNVSLSFSGGQSGGGSGASLTATLSVGTGSGATFTPVMLFYTPGSFYYVDHVVVTNGGSGYGVATVLSFTGGGVPTRQAAGTPVIVGGVITSVTMNDHGVYATSTPLPTITATGSGIYFVSGVSIVNGGTGYSGTAVASCYGGGSPTTQATLSLTVTGGIITAVTINDGGLYGSNTPPNIGVNDPQLVASASIILMPFAISGTALETYSGRIWIANGSTITYSAPGSVYDFSSASGGGNLTSSDSFLRVGYTQLKQTNGFLYLIGDSSVNYISGVQTSGSPPQTTFTNQNADPEVGTPWPGTVDVFGRNIVFANAFGAHISYGAAVTKISEVLDGVYNTRGPTFGGLFPSAAKSIVFGKKVWILLLPIVDPISGSNTNKLFMWNGKIWWSSEQDVQLQYIQHQEINSVLTAYGTDGTNVYPLFNTPSTAFTKVVQSKLWNIPGSYRLTKAVTRLWGLLKYYSLSSGSLTVTIDNDTITPDTNTIAAPASTNGFAVIPPTSVGQYGPIVGMTVKTNCADMAIISMAMDAQLVQYRG